MIANDSCKCLTISLSSLRLKRCLCWFSLSISWVEWPQKHIYLAKLQLLRKLHSLKGRFSANGKLTFQSILQVAQLAWWVPSWPVPSVDWTSSETTFGIILKISVWSTSTLRRTLLAAGQQINIASKSNKETELGSWPPPRRPTLIIESSSSISCAKWSYLKQPKLNVL